MSHRLASAGANKLAASYDAPIMYRVLLTDYAWPNLNIERTILQKAGAELIVADATDAASLARQAADCDAIMTNWVNVPESVIAAAPKCKIIARLGIGLDNIDVAAATLRGIVVTNVPDYCVTEVAEHALALMLSLARKVAFYHHETKSVRYNLIDGLPIHRIEGQSLGIVGFGNIGRKLADKAVGIGLNVLACARTPRKAGELPRGVTWCELDKVISNSDFISLHVPLNSDTKHLIGAEQLARMKPSAFIINTARGGLIDHAALAAALAANKLAGAALDVQDSEPPNLSQPPYNDQRVIVTPHVAFVSFESLENLRTRTATQVATRLRGEWPENIVNPEARNVAKTQHDLINVKP